MRIAAFLVSALIFSGVTSVEAVPVRVRLSEGTSRGFVVLRSLAGEELARGEFNQKPSGRVIESRFVLHFLDGSLRDELAVFSQHRVFRLERYRLIQRGPSFPILEVTFDRKSGRFDATTQEKKEDKPQHASGSLPLPADL